MYGAIYGDLVGSTYEYEQTKKVKPIKWDYHLDEKSFYSDDTILTIAICDAIKSGGDYEEYLKKYILDYKDYKPNFSPYFKSAFSPRIISWAEGKENNKSKGNGAMMRISPVGYLFDTEKDIIEQTTMATVPSHFTSEAVFSAATVAYMIYYLRKGYTKDEILERFNYTPRYTPFDKFNTRCYETLGNCIYAFYNSNSFDDAMYKTLLMGGDTDTNCCIVGSIAEACYGLDNKIITTVEEKLPDEFVKVLKR